MIIRGFLLRDPAGARTQDPNIKSHFSYLCAIINNIQSLIYG